MNELVGNDRQKVISIMKNNQHELTVDTVINCKSPGNVYVDDINHPQSFFIKTSECNLIGGNALNQTFDTEI